MKLIKRFILLFACVISLKAHAGIDSVHFQQLSKFEYSPPLFQQYSAFTAIFDKNGNEYVYTANSEFGLVIFDISDKTNPIPTDTITVADFNNLRPMNLDQQGDYVYVALGSFFGSGQTSGMAVLDVSQPSNAVLVSQWDSAYFNKGTPVLRVDEPFVYLGVMDSGLVILNVANKTDIQFVSHLVPDPDYPQPATAFAHAQTRGMDFRNDTIWLCIDRQGLRMIDVSDKQNPVEIGKYFNPVLYNDIRPANNEVVLIDNFAFVSIDHCGMEVVDISSTNMQLVFIYNPWDCVGLGANGWNGAPGHTNQMAISGDSLLFVSGADSEVLVFNIKNRQNPELVGTYGEPGDLSATWGLDVRDNYIVLANVHAQIPYSSNWGGIQILEWYVDPAVSTRDDIDEKLTASFIIFPNPFSEMITIEFDGVFNLQLEFEVYNSLGQKVKSGVLQNSEPKTVDLSDFPTGVYQFVILHGEEDVHVERVMKK